MITAILIAFVLICCAWPGLVRRRQPLLIAIGAALAALVLTLFAGFPFISLLVRFLVGLLNISIFLMLVLACTGLTIPALMREMSNAFRNLGAESEPPPPPPPAS